MLKFFPPKFAILFLLAFSFQNINALTYYISVNGNDNSAGTSPLTAWKTITKLNTINLLPGTVVLFEGSLSYPGTIQLNASDANDSFNPVIISSYGSGKAIILSDKGMGLYAFDTKGFRISDLIFEGAGMNINTTDGVKIHTNLPGNVKLSNIKITNVEIRNYGLVGLFIYSSNYNTGFKDVLIDEVVIHDVRENGLFIKGHTSPQHVGWSHQNVIIRNSEVYNVPGYADVNSHRGSGIIMAQVDNGIIEKSAAHHTGMANTHCGGPGGIWAYDCTNITIQHCESYSNSAGTGCDGLGFDLDGGITNSVIQYNYSHDNDGAGYLLGQYENARLWSNNVVRYNISVNDGRTNSGGITLFKGPNSTMNGCKIYHNTVYTSPSPLNSGVSAFTLTDWNTGITGIEVYNNIFQTTGGAYLVNVPVGYDATFNGNLYWSSGGTFKIRYHGTNYTTVAAWRTASGKEQIGSQFTGITANPQLVNAGNNSIVWPAPANSLNAYQLSPSSPALNTALNLSSLFAVNTGSLDFFGSVLTSANTRDIGAFEQPAVIITALNEEVVATSDKIIYYPNPVNAGESISFSGGEAPYSIELYSMNGLLVQRIEQLEETLKISDNLNGIFILRIKDNQGKTNTGKIIIR